MSYFTNRDLIHTSNMILKYIINVDESGGTVSMIQYDSYDVSNG